MTMPVTCYLPDYKGVLLTTEGMDCRTCGASSLPNVDLIHRAGCTLLTPKPTDLTELLAALDPFLRCEAATKGGTCWPRCDGPERKALAEAVERVKGDRA